MESIPGRFWRRKIIFHNRVSSLLFVLCDINLIIFVPLLNTFNYPTEKDLY